MNGWHAHAHISALKWQCVDIAYVESVGKVAAIGIMIGGNYEYMYMRVMLKH